MPERKHLCTGGFSGDMGLTASQDALLNLPQSQPEHAENAGNAANGGEQGQQDGQVMSLSVPTAAAEFPSPRISPACLSGQENRQCLRN